MKQKSTGNARPRQSRQSTAPPTYRLEIAVPFGLTEITQTEIKQRFAGRAIVRWVERDHILCDYAGDLSALLALQTVTAVYLIAAFAVPRPRALLGEAHLRTLLERISSVQRLVPPDAYQTLSLSAAGSTSSVMTQLKEEVASRAGLNVVPRDGDLQLRLRRSHSGTGWEVLIRLSPRPLATRAWRVCNMEGALNGALAHAMVLLTQPRPGDVFLNPGCGSGTLLIERSAAAPAATIIGIDIDPRALECALWNIAASRYGNRIELHNWDARHLPLPDRSVDALCADLPFGHLIGSVEDNKLLYPGIIREAARVARPGARFAVVTHQVRLMETVLARSGEWDIERAMTVGLGRLRPRLFVLRRLSFP